MADTAQKSYDITQLDFLNKEYCALTDRNDKIIGYAPKGECHKMTKIKEGMLHRAFSIFLFNKQGQLLLQQRADEKITFPGYWTNTCCSHPIKTPNNEELDDKDQIGVKRAASRKLVHEIGISLPTESFSFITRVHYLGESDTEWGEHEIDYILFAQQDEIDATIYNRNEVKAAKLVTPDQLRGMLAQAARKEIKLTPWFALVAETFIFKWWESLHDVKNLKDETSIHRLGPGV